MCCVSGSSAPSEADAADSSMLSFAPSAAPSSSAQDAADTGIAQAIRKTWLSMQRLSTDPAVTIDMLDTAHQFMQAKDQERELQVCLDL